MKMDESLEAIHRWCTVCRTIKPVWPPFHPMLRLTYQTPQKSSKPEQISPAVFQASLGGGLLHLALVQTAWHHEQSIRPQKTSPEELTRFGKRSFRSFRHELNSSSVEHRKCRATPRTRCPSDGHLRGSLDFKKKCVINYSALQVASKDFQGKLLTQFFG